MHIQEGSLWRKWDLHIHPPYTQLSDQYKVGASEDVLAKFCEEIENSDVSVFGITDYFSNKAYNSFIETFKKKYPSSNKQFFFNLELRLNETVNKQLEEVNVHLLFNPDSISSVDGFLSKLKIIKTGKDGKAITCAELSTNADFAGATVSREAIIEAFEETFGKKAIRENHFLIFAAANNDGIRAESGKMRKAIISDEIDKISNGFIGSSSNVAYFLKEDRLEVKDEKIGPKPVVTGSDAHSFDDIKNFLGKTVLIETEKDGKKQVIKKETTWIKADPTYEGLKQILYEPYPGERVSISAVKPDQKDEYKVIKKIKFSGSNDFPEEIVFNGNLSSIIGSRSSGKSALLAYIAFAINEADTRSKIKGPGEGAAYHWDRIMPLNYSVEWADGKTTTEAPGKAIYLPQNYLFDKSKEPKEVKAKIAPVLFKSNPTFKVLYDSTNKKIEKINLSIEEHISKWFKIADDSEVIISSLNNFGEKKSIENERSGLERKIDDLKTKNNFDDADVKKYQAITEELAKKRERVEEISLEQQKLALPNGQIDLFKDVDFTIQSDVQEIPKKLQEKITEKLADSAKSALIEINKIGAEYLQELNKEKQECEESITKIQTENAEVIERYKQHEELQQLIANWNRQNEALGKIAALELRKAANEKDLKECETELKNNMANRMKALEELKASISTSASKPAHEIQFGIEYDIDSNDMQQLMSKINIRDKSEFIEQGELKINDIRNKPEEFISAIYYKEQKLIQGQVPIDVAKTTLQLTEKVLFTAEMEGDRIGGYQEPTMTPGKRALFALRLMLAESDEQWPLLIDQPEDDLDSRSIYDEIVPFLKQKKKERQIIMVSHNANLVIGADSEQLVIANRNGSDRKNSDGKQFNYQTGSLEFTKEYDDKCADTLQSQGVCEHACAILDGGRVAFETRKNKYNFK